MDDAQNAARVAARQKARESFSKRLRRAMANAERAEFAELGGQALLAREMGVRDESARKWLNGLSIPDQAKTRKLAKILGVDFSWLAVGVESEVETRDARERRKAVTILDGAVLYVRGLIQLGGGATAEIAKTDSRRSYADFTAIIDGRQFDIHVATAVEQPDRDYLVVVPAEYAKTTVLAVVPYRGSHAVLHMPTAALARHAQRRFGDLAVMIQIGEGGTFWTDGEEWPRIKNITRLAA